MGKTASFILKNAFSIAIVAISVSLLYDIAVCMAGILLPAEQIKEYMECNLGNIIKIMNGFILPLAYILISCVSTDIATKRLLRTGAIVAILCETARFIVSKNTSDYNIAKPLITGITFFVESLIVCYMWGVIRRNNKISKRKLLTLDLYLLLKLTVAPILFGAAGIVFAKTGSNSAIYTTEIIVYATELFFIFKIISPSIFCAEPEEKLCSSPYKFWNRYHLWWLAGLITTVIISEIILTR